MRELLAARTQDAIFRTPHADRRDHATGAIGNIGDTVSLLMIMQLPGIFLIWRHMPETKGRELDELSPEEALLSEAALT